MEALRVALVQVEWLGSRQAMEKQYLDLLPQAVAQGAKLICLPEFSLLPYFPGTRDKSGFEWAEPLKTGQTTQFLSQAAQKLGVMIVGSLYELAEDGNHYDTAVTFGAEGQFLNYTRKIHIPSGEGYHETDFFIGFDDYPVHDIGAVKIATPTCYDQWFPELARIYSMNGAEFIFYPTAIGSEPTDPTMDSKEQWQLVMRGHAIANGVYIGAANRIGHENEVTFYGSSFICDPMGNMLAEAGRDTVEVIVADLAPQVLSRWRGLFPLLHQRKPQTYRRLLDNHSQGNPPDWLE